MTYQEMIDVQLNLLDVFHDFCVKHKLNYSLNYGTLIGAIRHKGLIPWDDDVDVAMPREDFDRFFDLYNNENNPKYKVLNHRIRPEIDTKIGYLIDFDTAITTEMDTTIKEWKCLHIDIYPIDLLPQNRYFSKFFFYMTRLLNKVIYLRTLRINVPKGTRPFYKQFIVVLFRVLLFWVNVDCFLEILISLSEKFKKPACEFTEGDNASILCEFDTPKVFPARYFSEYTETLFNGKKYSIIKEYDKYLRLWYGDYMKLPSEADRHPKRDKFTKYLWK